MNATPTCGICGTGLGPSCLRNLCAACLFDTALESDLAEPRPPSSLSSVPSPQFAEYELLGELGRGGQGVVFRARQPRLGRIVALKTVPVIHLANDQARQRFLLEVRTASRLDHPNLIPIYEVGERDGFCFYSMKLIENKSLEKLVADGPPDAAAVRHAAAIVRKVALAIAHAHERGVLHRDLKPSNILLDWEDEPYVSDFGIARDLDQSPAITRTNAWLGTPAYVSPEVISNGSSQATITSDVYSLGALLYFVLTAQHPFGGATIAATIEAVQHTEPVRPRLLNPGLPADLETICLKCLEKDPAKRYPDAAALAGDLQRFLHNEPITARPITRLAKVIRWSQRNPALATAYSFLILLLFLILIASPLAVFRINQARRGAEAEALRARRAAYTSDLLLASKFAQGDNRGAAISLLAKYVPENRSANDRTNLETDLRGWEWHYLANLTRDQATDVLRWDNSTMFSMRLSPDGHWIATSGMQGIVNVWDAKRKTLVQRLAAPGNTNDDFMCTALFSPDSQYLAVASDLAGHTDFWEVGTWTKRFALTNGMSTRTRALAFSSDGRLFAAGLGANYPASGLMVWDLEERAPLARLPRANASKFQQT